MGFPEAIKTGFRKYVVFEGRAPRSEYWYWGLFAFLVSLVFSVLDLAMFPSMAWGPLNTATGLALFLPGLAVSIRRLHDIGRTGWWVLITLTLIGIFLLLYWATNKGDDGTNEYGPNPLDQDPAHG